MTEPRRHSNSSNGENRDPWASTGSFGTLSDAPIFSPAGLTDDQTFLPEHPTSDELLPAYAHSSSFMGTTDKPTDLHLRDRKSVV